MALQFLTSLLDRKNDSVLSSLCMLAKRTFKNQITIPKDVMEEVGEVEYFDVSYKEGQIVLKPVEVVGQGERLARVRQKIKALGLIESDIEKAVHWARRS